ncbi:MAG: SCO family protein [Deltaproteobacteria bacterium]|nr:SCO family protein [Deltaproteobacteria bacterium]
MSRGLRNPFLWAFVVGCAVITLMRPLLRRIPDPPPVIGQVPEFSLMTASGERYGSDELRGHVYVASFAATPARLQAMSSLARRYRDEGLDSIRLVSISADREDGAAARAREAAKTHGLDPRRWVLLHGPREQVRELAEHGFRIEPAAAAAGRSAGLDAAPGGEIFLVDAAGGLRGGYGADPLGLDEVFWRSRRVLEESKAGS